MIVFTILALIAIGGVIVLLIAASGMRGASRRGRHVGSDGTLVFADGGSDCSADGGGGCDGGGGGGGD